MASLPCYQTKEIIMTSIDKAVQWIRPTITVKDVEELKALYNEIMINGEPAETTRPMSYVCDTLLGIASYEPEGWFWHITAGARREARIWAMSQAADHLKKVKSLFE
jgi:hypothetical protein